MRDGLLVTWDQFRRDDAMAPPRPHAWSSVETPCLSPNEAALREPPAEPRVHGPVPARRWTDRRTPRA
jgi:hypothetical protein